LPQRGQTSIPNALRLTRAPPSNFAAHAFEVAQRYVPERALRVSEPLAQRGDGAWSHRSRVAFEVKLDQLG
jgi:hypothetical protein